MAKKQDNSYKWQCFNPLLQGMVIPNALIQGHVCGDNYEWGNHRRVEEKTHIPLLRACHLSSPQ